MPTRTAPALPRATVAGEKLTEKEWLAVRDTGIGGSEIAGILGISPWESPWSVWARKLGRLPSLVPTKPMIWGTVLEQPIAKQWSEESGIKSIQPPNITIYRSTECEIALSSPDRLTKAKDAWVEIKNVGSYRLTDWDQGIPDYYWVQAQWELAVSGLDLCHVVALVGGQDLRWRKVLADPEWQQMAFEKAEAFWGLVQTETEPDVDDSEATLKAMQSVYGEKITDPVEGGAELAIQVAAYQDAQAQEKAIDSAKNLARNKIQLILREHEVGTVEGVPFVSIKNLHRSGYEVAPGDYSRLTILKGAKA